jgi:membrane-bound serine protease (ClpP class)
MPPDWILISTLIAVGFGLMLIEVFLPGMIVGTIGLLCCLIATILAYAKHGMTAGSLTLLGLLVVIMGGFSLWMRLFPHTPMGKRMMLGAAKLSGPVIPSGPRVLPGQTGHAVTVLRPAGLAEFNSERIDVVTEGAFVSSGGQVQVIAVEPNRIIVRQI